MLELLKRLKLYLQMPSIERMSGIPKGTITQALKGTQGIPEKHVPAIKKTLKQLEKHLKGLK